MSEFLIRRAEADDATALGRLHVECWRGAYGGIMPDRVLDELSADAFAAHWRDVLGAPASPRMTHVAERDRTLMGFVASGASRDEDVVQVRAGELYALYVLPEVWGKRLGWRLWCAALNDLLRAGFLEVTLWVLEENARARAFYERVGFELELGRRKLIAREGAELPEVRYRMSLRA